MKYKLFTFLFVTFFINSAESAQKALSCPNIKGTWICTFYRDGKADGDTVLKITQTKAALSVYDKEMDEKIIYKLIDGTQYLFEKDEQNSYYSYELNCTKTTITINERINIYGGEYPMVMRKTATVSKDKKSLNIEYAHLYNGDPADPDNGPQIVDLKCKRN